jgi:hypothetical protein
VPFGKPLKRRETIMWRISLVMLLFLMTVAIARAEEPEPNYFQQVVINVNRIVIEAKAGLFDKDHQEFLDDLMPVEDFRFYVKPKIGKSYTIGFRFTF